MLQAGGRDGDSPAALPVGRSATLTSTEEVAPAVQGRPAVAEATARADTAWLRFVAAVAAAEAATRIRAVEGQPTAEVEPGEAAAEEVKQVGEVGEAAEAVEAVEAVEAQGELPLQGDQLAEEGVEQARGQAARPKRSKKKKKANLLLKQKIL